MKEASVAIVVLVAKVVARVEAIVVAMVVAENCRWRKGENPKRSC